MSAAIVPPRAASQPTSNMRFPNFDSFFPRTGTRERITAPNAAARNLLLSEHAPTYGNETKTNASRHRRSFRERLRSGGEANATRVQNETSGLRFGRSKYSFSKKNSVVSSSTVRDEKRANVNNLKDLVHKSDLFAKEDEEVQHVQNLTNVGARSNVTRQRIKSANPVSPRNRLPDDDDHGSLKDLKELMKNSDLMATDDTVEPVLRGSRFKHSKNMPGNDSIEGCVAKTSSIMETKLTTNNTENSGVKGSCFVQNKSNDAAKVEAIEPPVKGSRFIRTKNVQPTSTFPRDEYEDEDEDDGRSLRSLKEYMRKTELVGDEVGRREWLKGSRFEKKSNSDPLPGRPVLKGDRSRNTRCSSLMAKEEIRKERRKVKKEEAEVDDDEDDRGSLRSLKVFMASCDLLSDDGAPASPTAAAVRSTRSTSMNRRGSLGRSDSGRRSRSTIVNDEPPVLKRRLELRNDKEERRNLKIEEPKLNRRSSGSRLIRDPKGRVPPAVERRMKREKNLTIVQEDEHESVVRISPTKKEVEDDEDDRASLNSLRNFMATEGNILLSNDMVIPKTKKVEKSDKLIDSPVSDCDEEKEEVKRKVSSSRLLEYADERRPTTKDLNAEKVEVTRKLSSNRRMGYIDERRPMTNNISSTTRRTRLPPGSPRSDISDLGIRVGSTTAFNRFSRLDSPISEAGKSGSGDNASSSDGTEDKRISRKSSPRSVLLRGDGSGSIKAAGADLLKAINMEREYSGKYCNFYPMVGCFRCRACSRPLYSADAKFDARTGYPSFDRCYRGAVETTVGSRRASLRCSACKVHIGHIVDGEWMSYTNERHSVVSMAISYDSNPCGKLEMTLKSGVVV